MLNFITNKRGEALLLFFLVGGICSIEFARAVSPEYKVGIGDVLEVKVLGETEFSGAFRIGSDGTIDYPFLRKIEVKGKTTEELAKQLSVRLKDGYLADPQVSVEVKEYQSQRVVILGAVKSPGTYVLQEETRLLDLISKAGGINIEGGKRILLLRGGAKREFQTEKNQAAVEIGAELLSNAATKPVVIDFYRLAHEGDFSQNLVLADGDILNIPKANEIFVIGSVGRPGPVKYEDNLSLVQAITLAGGTTPTASTKSIYILRHGEKGEEKIDVRLDRMLENKEKNFSLMPNDMIVVPESFF